MDPLLRKWLDEKNLEFNHDGYSQETLNALKEFANYVVAQQGVEADVCHCAEKGYRFVCKNGVEIMSCCGARCSR